MSLLESVIMKVDEFNFSIKDGHNVACKNVI